MTRIFSISFTVILFIICPSNYRIVSFVSIQILSIDK